jgi:acetyl esterase
MAKVTLHPEIAAVFGAMTGLKPEEREASEVRAIMNGFALASQQPRPDDIEVEDHVADLSGRSLRIRIYRPKGLKGRAPVMFYFHGGGWVMGNIDTHDRYACYLTQVSGVAFVSVDYRLAPEYPYPACIEDAFDSVCWVCDNDERLNLDASRMGISGDSAGGQLTAACTLMSRKRGGPKISFQLLIYPVVDYDMTRASYHEWGDKILVTYPYSMWMFKQFYGDTLPIDDPLAFPLREPDLSGLPPAYVVTCEYDVLRDEGELYAKRLMDAGVSTTLRRVQGSTHPFMRAMSESKYVRSEMREMGHQIRRALLGE